ncbi:GNAT family N-acetyltransferase [Dictyobacter aurantiacus]|nr:GNAT family protein [Dictyobacter aurantiacus]
MMRVRSSRLSLEPLTASLIRSFFRDRREMAAALNARVPADWPESDFEAVLPLLLDGFEREPDHDSWDGVIILEGEERVVIGAMGLKGGPDEEGTVDIGYNILPAYQNQGYASEMARALVAWAFERGDVQKVIADCLYYNQGSIRVLEKVGMKRLYQDGDMLRWSLTREEWQAVQHQS